MSKRPLFSCVIPVKGARPYFAAALASLRAQGMGEDLEIIVQDADVEPDAGQSDALNRGFAKARGDWLFWLNADDLLLPGALRAVAETVRRRPAVRWIAGNTAYLDPSGRVRWCVWDRGWRLSYWRLPVQVYGPGSFFRRDLLRAAGGFDTALDYAMDVDMWCRFRRLGVWYAKVPRLVWGFRLHAGSKTHAAQEGVWTPEVARETGTICRRYGLAGGRSARLVATLTRIANGSYLAALILTGWLKGRSVAG